MNAEPGAGASLIVHACGKTEVIDLAAAKSNAKKVKRSDKTPAPKDLPGGLGTADDFVFHFAGTLPANARFQITIFELAEKPRDDAKAPRAVVFVDSIDGELHRKAARSK